MWAPARRRERARLAAAYRSFRPETLDEADVGNRQFHGGVSQQQEGCIYFARLEALVGETPEVEGDAKPLARRKGPEQLLDLRTGAAGVAATDTQLNVVIWRVGNR